MSKIPLGRPRGQMSESMLTAAFIILSGGLQDAYTYLCRGKVFANAQTGNIVLLSAALLRAAAGELRADVRARRARELSFLSKKSRNVHKTFLDFSYFLLII